MTRHGRPFEMLRARRRSAAARLLHAALLGATLLCAAKARADIIPEPRRPEEWRENPAPMPEPPPEKELPALVLIAWAVMMLVAASALRPRARTEAVRG